MLREGWKILRLSSNARQTPPPLATAHWAILWNVESASARRCAGGRGEAAGAALRRTGAGRHDGAHAESASLRVDCRPDGDRIAGLAQLKKHILRLSDSGKKSRAVTLPKPVRCMLERGEAYKIASEEVSARWAGVLARNPEAEVLHFMNGNAKTFGRNTSAVAEGFKPTC